jgi:hypothetical protein
MGSQLALIFTLAGNLFLLQSSYGSISEKTRTMNAVLDSSTYDARVRPKDGSDPVQININMFVASFSSISESDMEYTMDIYLR